MSFGDIFKQSFLDGFTVTQITTKTIIVALLVALCMGIYIFVAYFLTNRNHLYNVNFNISLVALTLITAGVILTIQSSVVVSLGMVGALSIVRFRTAVKDPMDLVYLFWSIGMGIMCGAMQFEIAILVSLVVTIAIIGIQLLPKASESKILIIRSNKPELAEDYLIVIKKWTAFSKLKAHNIRNIGLEMIVECRTNKGVELIQAVSEMDGVEFVSLMSQDGDIVY
ncbi:MAG: DUF4956 domain-containing protein [Lachnospiraceae bacterium]|nr:DUF4956 domain-containing protein [Lachnospiraceae bacterium]